MTWTYGSDPAANDRDAVRFLLGDTDTLDQQVNDAEVSWALTQAAGQRGAAAILAEALAAKYARLTSQGIGDASINYAQRQQHYSALATRLRADEALRGAVPYLGGMSVSDKETSENDEDRVRPAFRRGLHDNSADQDGSGTGDTANAT